MKISEQNKGAFLHKLMSKANIGWWEADLKTETYKCSELISELLGLEEDGVISFEDFNQRILREEATPLFLLLTNYNRQLKKSIYLTPLKVAYGFAVKCVLKKQTKTAIPKYMA